MACLAKWYPDAGTKFISEKFEIFFKWLSIHYAVASSYNHQGNGQVEACIMFVKRTIKCYETNAGIYTSLLQIKSTTISTRLLSRATLMFNRPVRSILPRLSRPPLLCDNDESSLTVLMNRQPQLIKNIGTCTDIPFLPTAVAVHQEDSGP